MPDATVVTHPSSHALNPRLPQQALAFDSREVARLMRAEYLRGLAAGQLVERFDSGHRIARATHRALGVGVAVGTGLGVVLTFVAAGWIA